MNNENGDFVINIPSEPDKKTKRKKNRRALSSDSVSPQSPQTPQTPQPHSEENIIPISYQDVPQMLTRETHQREVQVQLEQQADKFNTYATQKSVSQNLLNTALITQYIGMLVHIFTLFSSGNFNGFAVALLVFLFGSIVFQIVIFVLLVILAKTTRDNPNDRCSATSINIWVTALSGISVIVTITITSLSQQVLTATIAPINATN